MVVGSGLAVLFTLFKEHRGPGPLRVSDSMGLGEMRQHWAIIIIVVFVGIFTIIFVLKLPR